MMMPLAAVIRAAAGIPVPPITAVPPLRQLPQCDACGPQDFLGFNVQVHGYALSMSNFDDGVSQFDAELDAAVQEEVVAFDSLDDLLTDLDDQSDKPSTTEVLRQMRDEERY